MMPGLTVRMTSGRLPVLRLHYSADPAKRPGTPAGDGWITEAAAGYPGGTNSPRWRKEMEIDYGALGGTKLFPLWEQWIGLGKIVIPPFTPTGYRLYASYDHGWRNPACYHVHGINGDGQIVTLWEFYGANVPVPQVAELIKGQDVTLADGQRFHGNPFAGQEAFRIADPSMWAEDQPMADNTNKSIADLFRRCGVYFTQGERGGDTMVGEWLHGHFWKDPATPLYRICTTAPKLIWEIGQQRHKEVSARVGLHRDQPEQLQDKDNHAWDSLKYFLQRFPPTPASARPAAKPATFNWWRDAAKKAHAGQAVGTYRRSMAA